MNAYISLSNEKYVRRFAYDFLRLTGEYWALHSLRKAAKCHCHLRPCRQISLTTQSLIITLVKFIPIYRNYPCQVSCLFSGPWQNDSYIELGIAFNTNLTQPRVFVKRLLHLTLRLTTLPGLGTYRQCLSINVTQCHLACQGETWDILQILVSWVNLARLGSSLYMPLLLVAHLKQDKRSFMMLSILHWTYNVPSLITVINWTYTFFSKLCPLRDSA